MLEELRSWLNGSREYYLGALIYQQIGTIPALKEQFLTSYSNYLSQRLQKELTAICLQLKSDNPDSIPAVASLPDRTTNPFRIASLVMPAITNTEHPLQPENEFISNPELYTACRDIAMKTYKESMNARAVVFSLLPSQQYDDPNRADLVLLRSPLCIKAVTLNIEASRLFDIADFVKQFGRLPDSEIITETITPPEIPDGEVKQRLDNLRKNYNKMLKRTPTPERIELLQKHKAEIDQLLTRCHSLKQKLPASPPKTKTKSTLSKTPTIVSFVKTRRN